MTDNVAILNGYTTLVHATNDQGDELFLLVEPETDLEDVFRAWDTDEQKFISVNGWLWYIEIADEYSNELGDNGNEQQQGLVRTPE